MSRQNGRVLSKGGFDQRSRTRDTKTKAGSLLYSIFGPRVPDYGTVIFYREIKLKLGFGV